MKKLSNTEAVLKKSVAYIKKARIPRKIKIRVIIKIRHNKNENKIKKKYNKRISTVIKSIDFFSLGDRLRRMDI